MRHHLSRRIGLMVLGFSLIGCGGVSRKLEYKPSELSELLQQRLGSQEAARIQVPYEADAEMIAFAREAVARQRTIRGKVEALTQAMTGRAHLDVHYDAGRTLTAREVFVHSRANCVAYTNLFIALARAVGLDAYYAEVTERSRYVRRAGTILHIGHLCAAVRDGPQTLLVDFADASRLQYVGYRLIDDLDALSNFMINRGVDFGGLLALPDVANFKMQFTDQEMENFRQVLRFNPTFSKGLLNLGTAHVLRGELQQAEEYFREAIRVDPDFAAGYTALGNLLCNQRRLTEAVELYRKAATRQNRNPYLFYNLALTNFRLQRFKEAQKAARTAAKIEPTFADPQYLLGIIAQIQGDNLKAREHLQLAHHLDPGLIDVTTRLNHIEAELGEKPAGAPLVVPVSSLNSIAGPLDRALP